MVAEIERCFFFITDHDYTSDRVALFDLHPTGTAAVLSEHGGVLGGLLGDDLIGPLTVLHLGGFDAQAHLLFQHAAEESANGMSLPAGGLLQLLEGSAARPLEQGQNLGCLRAPPGCGGLAAARPGYSGTTAGFGFSPASSGTCARSRLGDKWFGIIPSMGRGSDFF